MSITRIVLLIMAIAVVLIVVRTMLGTRGR
jgi:hypothetical protein